jgi:hypothetical protein
VDPTPQNCFGARGRPASLRRVRLRDCGRVDGDHEVKNSGIPLVSTTSLREHLSNWGSGPFAYAIVICS